MHLPYWKSVYFGEFCWCLYHSGTHATGFGGKGFESAIHNFAKWCEEDHPILNTKTTNRGDVVWPHILGWSFTSVNPPPEHRRWAPTGTGAFTKITIRCGNVKTLFKGTAEDFLRRLRTFGVTWSMQVLFYHVVVKSLLHSRISAWFGKFWIGLGVPR